MAVEFVSNIKQWWLNLSKKGAYNGGTLGDLDSTAFKSWFFGLGIGDDPYENLTFPTVAKDGFEQNVITYKCVMSIAQGIADLQFPLYNKKTNEQVKTHPLIDLLCRPNPMQGQQSFIQHAFADLLLDGNMFIEKVRPNPNAPNSRNNLPARLNTLQPNWVQIATGESRIPESYTYTAGGIEGGYSKVFPVDPTNGKSDCLHIKSYAPLREMTMGRGLSPVRSAWRQVLTHNEGARWNYMLLKLGARPTGVLQAKNNLTKEQINDLREQLVEYQGRNSSKPLVLDGGLEWQEMSLSPVDMAYLEGKNSVARDICLALGMPPLLMHIPGDTTYNNVEQAALSFYEETIVPRAKHFICELNYWLVTDFDPNLEFRIDLESIPSLAPRRAAKWNAINAASFLTINEKREQLGFPPIKSGGGDDILVPSNLIPLDAETEPASTPGETIPPASGTTSPPNPDEEIDPDDPDDGADVNA